MLKRLLKALRAASPSVPYIEVLILAFALPWVLLFIYYIDIRYYGYDWLTLSGLLAVPVLLFIMFCIAAGSAGD